MSAGFATVDRLTGALSTLSSVDSLGSISEVHLQPFLNAFEATSIVGLRHRFFAGQLRPQALAFVNQQPTRVEAYLQDYHAIDPVIGYWMNNAHKNCSVFRLSDARQSFGRRVDTRFDGFLNTVDVGHILVFNIGIQDAREGAPGETILLALQRRKECDDFSSGDCEAAATVAPILRQIIRGIGRKEPRQELVEAARSLFRAHKEHELVVIDEDLTPLVATSKAQGNHGYSALYSRDPKIVGELQDLISASENPDMPQTTGAVRERRGIASVERFGSQSNLWLVKLSSSDPQLTGHSLAALTPRQREVAQLVLQGYRNWQIADILQISENTVVNHLSAIYDRTGANGRTALAIMMGGGRPH